MVLSKSIFYVVAGLVALTTDAAPLQKRIAQVISDSTQQWVQACTAAGGAEKCGTTSQTAFMTLLAGAGDCDQQNAADDMVSLAKSLNNDAKMISLAQVFAQQPRNSPNKLSVNYCQQQPKNPELKGLFQCQFQGVDPQTFTNNVKVGGPGTIPLGLNAPLDPSGSCKAHPQGGIADGSQLVASTQNPGLDNNVGAGSGKSNSSTSNAGSSPSSSGPGDSANAGSSDSQNGSNTATVTVTAPAVTVTVNSDGGATGSAASATPTDSTTVGSTGGNGNGASGASTDGATSPAGFKLQNGKDAQALNAKFASLTASSTCNEGEQACIDQGFAQCVGGKFVNTQCAGGTQCFALPLVNKAGTSIACTTESDATTRIQATGATGGLTGA